MMRIRILLASVFSAVALSVSAAAPKYVFLFIGDGMSTPQRQVTEAFAVKSGYGKLAMNALPYKAATGTKSADKVVTDSAAAATAIACGVKTKNGRLGMDAGGTNVQSVAEVAKARGMKVGILTSVTIYHATPAGFYAHRKSRGLSYEIGLDLVASGFDYFAGGGFGARARDRKSPFYRGDILDLAKQAGYTVVRDRKGWEALVPGGKALCLFGSTGLPFTIDADIAREKNRPALSELLAKGIELLDGPEGFFIMCEGGKIDYACHANDAATSLRDVLELDKAVKTALAFLEKRPDETLVLVTGDHETGGLSMGFAGTGGRFDVELLACQKVSVEAYSERIKRRIRDCEGRLALKDLEDDLRKNFGFVFPGRPRPDGKFSCVALTEGDVTALEKALAQDVEKVRARLEDTTAHNVSRRYVFAQAVKNVLNAHAGVAWGTGSHTALPTLTTATGVGAEIVDGMTENADIGLRLKKLLTAK